jgi:hypothetical protein
MRHWTNPPSCPNRAVNMDMGFVDYLCLRDRNPTRQGSDATHGPAGPALVLVGHIAGVCGRRRRCVRPRAADSGTAARRRLPLQEDDDAQGLWRAEHGRGQPKHHLSRKWS